MTSIIKPEFMDNEYAFKEDGVWKYEEEASEDLKKEVDNYNKIIEKKGKETLL